MCLKAPESPSGVIFFIYQNFFLAKYLVRQIFLFSFVFAKNNLLITCIIKTTLGKQPNFPIFLLTALLKSFHTENVLLVLVITSDCPHPNRQTIAKSRKIAWKWSTQYGLVSKYFVPEPLVRGFLLHTPTKRTCIKELRLLTPLLDSPNFFYKSYNNTISVD